MTRDDGIVHDAGMCRFVLLLSAVAACGHHGVATVDAAAQLDAAPDAAACARVAAPADRVRRVAISLPYDAAGNQANGWELLDLSAAGALSRPGRTFAMGRATVGEVAFTPDGKIGLAAQDDGTLGVFAIDDTGAPTVIAAQLHGSFYATSIVVAPTGDHAYVLDDQWRENGGGIYRVDIACDGTVTDRGLVVAAKSPAALAFVPGTSRAVVAANDFASSAAGDTAQLVDWSASPAWVAGADAFGDQTAIVGGAALTADAGHFLVGDTNQFGGIPNRVAIVDVNATAVANPIVLPNIQDPIALVASPFGDVVLVASGFGNALYVIDRGGSGGAFRLRGEVAYVGAKPELPGGAVGITAGMLRGWVLVSENLGVRRVRMDSDGTVTDLGKFPTGSGTQNIVGAIGVTP